jgi:copper chaperone CopZ
MNKKLQKFGLLFLIGLVFGLQIYSYALDKIDSNSKTNESPSALHRLDFRIEGKGCAACLLSIQRKLNSLPGVKEAVVMLKRPFGTSVIYQTTQIKKEEILAIVQNKEPNIKIVEVSDSSIAKVPSPMIPPFVSTLDSSEPH